MPKKLHDHSKVLALYDTGISMKEISKKTGILQNVVENILFTHPEHPKRKFHLQKKGQKHNRAKLTEKQAIEIIKLRNNGALYSVIAEKYKIHKTNARCIYTGKSWPHLQYLVKPKINNQKG